MKGNIERIRPGISRVYTSGSDADTHARGHEHGMLIEPAGASSGISHALFVTKHEENGSRSIEAILKSKEVDFISSFLNFIYTAKDSHLLVDFGYDVTKAGGHP